MAWSYGMPWMRCCEIYQGRWTIIEVHVVKLSKSVPVHCRTWNYIKHSQNHSVARSSSETVLGILYHTATIPNAEAYVRLRRHCIAERIFYNNKMGVPSFSLLSSIEPRIQNDPSLNLGKVDIYKSEMHLFIVKIYTHISLIQFWKIWIIVIWFEQGNQSAL